MIYENKARKGGWFAMVVARFVPSLVAGVATVFFMARGATPAALVGFAATMFALVVATQRQPRSSAWIDAHPQLAGSPIKRQWLRPNGSVWPIGALITIVVVVTNMLDRTWSQLWWQASIGLLVMATGFYLQDRPRQ
jgi:hypothetical protein